MGFCQLLLFQCTILLLGNELLRSSSLQLCSQKHTTGPFADNVNSCAPSQVTYLKQHSVLSSSLQRGINISDVTSKSFAGISHFSMRATYPSLLSKLSSTLCSFLHPFVVAAFFQTKRRLRTIFPKASNLRFPFKMEDHISYSYKIKLKILCINLYVWAQRREESQRKFLDFRLPLLFL